MNPSLANARSYLTPPANSLWRWSDDGSTLEWADGRTIAFRAEVHDILLRLAPGGLPSFTAIVLLLAASRNAWAQAGADHGLVAGYASSLVSSFVDTTAGALATATLSLRMSRETIGALNHLDRIARFGPEYRTSLAAKTVLCEAVFEGADRPASQAVARAAVEHLGAAELDAAMFSDPAQWRPDAIENFVTAIEALKPGIERVTEQRLALWAKTSLEQLVEPAPAELDLAPPERVRRLLADLHSDTELAGLAALARDLLAAVHVPRSLIAPDELPLGGVSDLSNRGPLDRLLVSELAHDDLTLAVRVVLNEALYLRRESPPRSPPHRRAVLLDSGIRLWGVGRIFATAVGMALAATADAGADLCTFRAARDGGVETVDLTSRDGLIAHLAALETAPHPGESLEIFFETVDQLGPSSELVVVTHEDAASDPDFVRITSAMNPRSWLLATVGRSGAFVLYAMSPQGRHVIRKATLKLESLLAPPPDSGKAIALRDSRLSGEYPLILSLESFPLLLPPAGVAPKTVISDKLGAVGLTHDARLLHWKSASMGARQLSATIRRGHVEGGLIDATAERAWFVIRSQGGARPIMRSLISGDLHHAFVTDTKLDSMTQTAVGVGRHGSVLLVFFKPFVEAFDLVDGKRFTQLVLPDHYRWLHGRFIRDEGHFFAVAFDGQQLRLEQVPTHRAAPLTVFECEGIDSPLILSHTGDISSTDPHSHFFIKGLSQPITLLEISADGARVTVRDHSSKLHIADVPTGRWKEIDLRATSPGAGFAHPLLSLRHTLRTRFRGMIITPDRRLALVARRTDNIAAIIRKGADLLFENRGMYESQRMARLIPFSPIESPPGTRYSLVLATLPNGSRAFLDSRGLLHLQDADRAALQMTLVLAEGGALAGWSSDGRVFGPRYFHGSDVSWDVSHFDDILRRFVEGAS